MAKRRYRLPMRAVAIALSVACFLSFSGGAVSRAVAQDAPGTPTTPGTPATPGAPGTTDTWETWPPKKTGEAATQTGEAAGKKTSSGLSAGTWTLIGLGAAALIGIGIAVSGGSSNSNH